MRTFTLQLPDDTDDVDAWDEALNKFEVDVEKMFSYLAPSEREALITRLRDRLEADLQGGS